MNYFAKSENSVAILFSVAVLSMSYPYGFPLFGVLALLLISIKLFKSHIKFRMNLGFLLFLIAVFSYTFSLLFNHGTIYSNNISDLINIIGFFIVYALLSDVELENYPLLINNISKMTILVSLIVSIISLYKFYALTNGQMLNQFYIGTYYPDGTSLVRDYNMFSLALITGLFMSVLMLTKAKDIHQYIYYFTSFIVIFSSIMLAGSRRAWIAAIIIALFVIYIILKSFLKESNIISWIKTLYVGSFTGLIIFIIMYYYDLSISIQNNAQIQDFNYRLQTLKIDQASESFSPRTDRWNYTLELFSQYNFIELFFGSGFDYLTEFSLVFSPFLQEDYPHNPFLSALLYSGVLGVVILSFLFLAVSIKAVKIRGVIGAPMTVLFFLSWLFVLISSNSIFSITLFVILMLLIISVPYHKKSVLS